METYKSILICGFIGSVIMYGCGDPKKEQNKSKQPAEKYQQSSSIALGDMDNDGDLDIVILDDFSRLHYLENLGKSKFEDKGQIGKNYSELSDISRIVIADIDQDGKPDIVMTDKNGSVYVEDNATKK